MNKETISKYVTTAVLSFFGGCELGAYIDENAFQPYLAWTEDVNKDGKLDIVVMNKSGGEKTYMLAQPDGKYLSLKAFQRQLLDSMDSSVQSKRHDLDSLVNAIENKH